MKFRTKYFDRILFKPKWRSMNEKRFFTNVLHECVHLLFIVCSMRWSSTYLWKNGTFVKTLRLLNIGNSSAIRRSEFDWMFRYHPHSHQLSISNWKFNRDCSLRESITMSGLHNAQMYSFEVQIFRRIFPSNHILVSTDSGYSFQPKARNIFILSTLNSFVRFSSQYNFIYRFNSGPSLFIHV